MCSSGDVAWTAISGCPTSGAASYFLDDPSMSVAVAVRTDSECCEHVETHNRAGNPIIAYAMLNASSSQPTCIMHRMKLLSTIRKAARRSAAWLAQQGGCANPVTTHYAPADTSCAGFSASVGDLSLATGASASSAVAFTVAVANASVCCAICAAEPTCVAHQLRPQDGGCRMISSAVLSAADVAAVDISGWARSDVPGEGIFYHREPPATGLGLAVVDAGNASAPPITCKHFTSTPARGATLLDRGGASALGDETRTILHEGVGSEAACCELARRWGCNANPVSAWQLLSGDRCVLHRSRFLPPGLSAAAAVGSLVAAANPSKAREGKSASSVPRPSTRPIYHTELRNTGMGNTQCDDLGRLGEGMFAAPCTETEALGVCATATEPCYYDPTCKQGGLGCNAAGFEQCRFCGFSQYSPISCPGSQPTTQVEATLELTDRCPSACTSLEWETCFHDPSCSDPMSADYQGGIGCNAGGKGQNCRFCGFKANNGTLLNQGQEYFAGDEYAEYVQCPSAPETIAQLTSEVSKALHTEGKTGESESKAEVKTVVTITVEVGIADGSPLSAAQIAERFQAFLCSLRKSGEGGACDVALLSAVATPVTSGAGRRLLQKEGAGAGAGGRRLQLAVARVEVLQLAVSHDATNADAAAIDAALNDAPQMEGLLTAADPSVVVAGVSSEQTIAEQILLRATVPASSAAPVAADTQRLRTALAAAVSTSMGVEVAAEQLTNVTAVARPPTFDPANLGVAVGTPGGGSAGGSSPPSASPTICDPVTNPSGCAVDDESSRQETGGTATDFTLPAWAIWLIASSSAILLLAVLGFSLHMAQARSGKRAIVELEVK